MKLSSVDVSVPLTLMGGQTGEKSGEGQSLLSLVTACDCHVIYRAIGSRRGRAENEV